MSQKRKNFIQIRVKLDRLENAKLIKLKYLFEVSSKEKAIKKLIREFPIKEYCLSKLKKWNTTKENM